MATFVLLPLAGLAEEPRSLELTRAALDLMQEMPAQYLLGFAQWLIALDYALSHPREIAVVGDTGAADTRALLDVCTAGYRPHQILALGDLRVSDDLLDDATQRLGLLDPQPHQVHREFVAVCLRSCLPNDFAPGEPLRKCGDLGRGDL
jgi:uncharacterized protein YyaL (SSP411 family)